MTGSDPTARRANAAPGLQSAPATGPSGCPTNVSGLDDRHRGIPREQRWRQPPPPACLPDGRRARLAVSNWCGTVGPTPLEVSADDCCDAHVVSYVVRRTNLTLAVDGQTLLDGDVPAGTTILSGPDRRHSRAIYRRDFDIVRVFVPQFALAECFTAATGHAAPSRIALFHARQSDDIVLRHLMMTLIRAADEGTPLSPPFLDSMGTTFAAHLIGQYAHNTVDRAPETARRSLSPLAPWRLKRATSFVEANLTRPISLVDLSTAAGLSRMHFAAQFRSATGVSPHTYVLQRRIETAKQLLQDPQRTIRNVAFAVGFKSEAHFVNVFRRLVGDSPGRWRRSMQQ